MSHTIQDSVHTETLIWNSSIVTLLWFETSCWSAIKKKSFYGSDKIWYIIWYIDYIFNYECKWISKKTNFTDLKIEIGLYHNRYMEMENKKQKEMWITASYEAADRVWSFCLLLFLRINFLIGKCWCCDCCRTAARACDVSPPLTKEEGKQEERKVV